MAAAPPDLPPDDEPPHHRRRRWIWPWIVGLFAILLLAVPAGLFWLSETRSGRGFVAARVAGIAPESGLRFAVGRIDGSLWSRFRLVDVTVIDLDGPFARIPHADVEWQPVTLLARRVISIDRLAVPDIRLLRLPRLNPSDPDDPLLPDIDIRIGQFTIERLILEEPVIGQRRVIRALGETDIKAGRLLLGLDATADPGDRLRLRVDAEPDGDRFDLSANLAAPAGGMLDTLTGLGQPLILVADGAGSWTDWRGRLITDLGNGAGRQRLADLQLSAAAGRYRARGRLVPGPLLDGEGTLARLVEPGVDVDVIGGEESMPDGLRAWRARLIAQTDALALTGSGALDTRGARLLDTRLGMAVRRPQLVDPRLSARGLAASLSAEGPLSDPDIRWTVRAPAIALRGEDGPIGAEGLVAAGSVRLAGDDRPLAIPFSATAARLAGLPPEILALTRNPRLSGRLLVTDAGLSADALRLVTSELEASGTARLASSGRLTGDLQASVPRYRQPGTGSFAIRASARIDQPPGGALSATGAFEARALALENEGAADFLGGLPTASGRFALAPDGTLRVADGRLASPNLDLRPVAASYDPASGRFTLETQGLSRQYGALALTAAGTTTAPRARLALARPGFGLGVTDFVADLEPGAGGGFLITASGQSPQGPLSGRATLLVANGQPLTIEVHRASFASLNARGTLVQTPAGPFSGRLSVSGGGLEARVRLAAEGAIQRADVEAEARNARLPLDPPVRIGSGQARFALRLVPGRPEVRGSLIARQVSREGLLLTELRGAANLAGDSGLATVSATGRARGGEALRLDSRIRPVASGYLVSLDGRLGNRALRLASPARIVRLEGGQGFELRPARLEVPGGHILLSGRTGAETAADVQLTDVDLGLADLVLAGSGLGGRASGRLSYRARAGAPLPELVADLRLTGLQRPSITGVSLPVDARVAARSTGDALQAGARLSLNGEDLGRLVLRVEPGPGATPAARFGAGRLSGGIRYNGPVEPIWALVGLEGQELRGPVVIAADLAGTPDAPRITGLARGQRLVYRNAEFGTELANIAFDGRFSGAGLQLSRFTATAAGGTLSGQGTVRLDTGGPPAVEFRATLENARLADSDTLELTLSGPVALSGTTQRATLAGDLRVVSARVQLMQVEVSEVPQLAVRRRGELAMPAEPGFGAGAIALDLRIRADDRVRVEGMGLDSIWRADLRARGTASAPRLSGTATLARGEFSFAGSDFDITTGRITFNGQLLDSNIDIQAQTRTADILAFVRVAGTAARPDVRITSQPALPEDEILSRLLFGSSVADLSLPEAVQLASAVAGLRSGVDTLGRIRRSVGLDRLRLVGGGANGMGTGLAIGQRLTRNLYVEVVADAQGNTLTTLQLTLSRIWSLLFEVSSVGRNSANVRYQREY